LSGKARLILAAKPYCYRARLSTMVGSTFGYGWSDLRRWLVRPSAVVGGKSSTEGGCEPQQDFGGHVEVGFGTRGRTGVRFIGW